MSQEHNDISTTSTQDMEKQSNQHERFKEKMVRLNAVACNKFNSDEYDSGKAISESQSGLQALEANGGLQVMLAAQILSIHQLQQISIAMANTTTDTDSRRYFTNTTIKLANTFVQQANLLAKLQGNGGQKIVVEHVDVHQGGQAIVGDINLNIPMVEEVKK